MTTRSTYELMAHRLQQIEMDLRRLRVGSRKQRSNGHSRNLWDQEDRFRQMFQKTSQGMAIVGLDGTFLEVNSSLCRLFGLSSSELLRENVKNITHPSPLEPESHWNLQSLNGDRTSIWLEQRYWRKKGRIVYGMVSGHVVRDDNEKPLYIIVHVQDITNRKLAEARLRESEERYRMCLEHSSDGFALTQGGSLMYFNQRFLDMFGYTDRAQLKGEPFETIIHPVDREVVMAHLRKVMAQTSAPSRYEFRGVQRDGETVWVEVSLANSTYRGKPVNLAFFRDNTERKQLEQERHALQERLQHVQKMEAIGTLAGGIAHEFNNILMAIQGRAALMRMEITPKHPHFAQLDEVEHHVKRASRLTRQLLGFARGGKYDIKPTNLNRLIGTSLQMFGSSRSEITIYTDFEEDPWVVEADQGQMEQALLNIFVNAWQAMPEGGDLYVKTSNLVLKVSNVAPYGLPPGRYVKIVVTDTGSGMNGETLKRIFDPFFTTKKAENNTGLGLSSTYGIIKNHRGIIQAASKIGVGSVFTVYLPAAETMEASETKPVHKVVQGKETILVVDDEPTVLRVADEMLTRTGYKVLTAKNGKEAIERFTAQPNRVDLVMLDMVMPVLDGGKTFDRLRELDPEVKVLLSSGYSLEGQAADIMSRGCNGFIQKPFSLRELTSKISEILNKKKSKTSWAPRIVG